MSAVTRETIIEAARAAALQSGSPISQIDFTRLSGISQYHIHQAFPDGGWAELRDLAGIQPHPGYREPISDDQLLADLHRVASQLGSMPTWAKLGSMTSASEKTIKRRFGGRQGTIRAYRAWLEMHEPNSPLLAAMGEMAEMEIRKPVGAPEPGRPSAWAKLDGIEYGAPINFRGLRHAPINEQGVVYLFGMVSNELGLIVEAVQAGFPDCEAKRCVNSKENRWQRVRIEFEFRSRNFVDHGHRPDGCDLIVCWEHNWQDCPLEVIELRSDIYRLVGMVLTWLDHFQRGQFSSELLKLAINVPAGNFRGQGFLWWDRKRGARIRALTDGAQGLQRLFTGVQPLGVGALIRSSQYATIDATNQRGEAVHISRLSPHCYSTSTATPTATWKFGQKEILSAVTFTQAINGHDEALTELLLTNANGMLWPRSAPTSLSFECNNGIVEGWKRNGLARLLIRHKGSCTLSSLVGGLLATFTFWAGCLVQAIALEHHSAQARLRRIFRLPGIGHSQPAFPPLGVIRDLRVNPEPLLAKSLDFFCDEHNGDVATLVYTLAMSSEMTFSASTLIACTCLEGMAKRVAEQNQIPTPPAEKQKQSDQRKLIEQFLKDNDISPTVANRFKGVLENVNRVNGANAISELCKSGRLGFTLEDRKAFASLRNSTAHGTLRVFGEDDDAKQQAISKRNRVYNMLNKLVLNAIGYDGMYFDYVDWTTKPFPSTS
jgi:hypothetical protein